MKCECYYKKCLHKMYIKNTITISFWSFFFNATIQKVSLYLQLHQLMNKNKDNSNKNERKCINN